MDVEPRERPLPEGLRDRKKRLLRQLISDTATSMFLEHGFDEVKVSDIADACEVSEKTVYNYFPTKESLLFDREEDMARQIHEAITDTASPSLTAAALEVLEADVTRMYSSWDTKRDPPDALDVIERFGQLIENTPALVAAQHGMMERLTDAAAVALAERAGIDPEDPETQIAALMIVGLWRVQFVSMRRNARSGTDMSDVTAAVIDDLRRAARLAESGLSSFNLVVHGARTKDQLREAADATNEARKQVLAAVKQAKDSWRQVMAEMHESQHAMQAQMHMTKAEMKAQQWAMRDEIRRKQAEIRQKQAELRRQQIVERRAAHDHRKRTRDD